MTTVLHGLYFYPHSTRCVEARAAAMPDRKLRIEDAADAVLAEFPAAQIRVSPRLGRLTRRLELPDGARFETGDNDGVDILSRTLGLRTPGRALARIERSGRWIAAAIVAAALLSYAFIDQAVPAIALKLAQVTPPSIAAIVSRQTLDVMDRSMLGPTRLSAADRAHAFAVFARVAKQAPRGSSGYRLTLRHGRAIGANAFALPDGTVVMTDELWALVKNDAEIEGVFAHEMSHVDHAHGLQRVYQASMIPAAIALITGDVSQVSQLATILPGVLVQSAYARGFEQQADDDAAKTLIAMGAKPSSLADLLERLEAKHCGKRGCAPSWLGSHPDTAVRATKLRAETPTAKR